MVPVARESRLVWFFVANACDICFFFRMLAMERKVRIVTISLSDHVVRNGRSGEVSVYANVHGTA